MKKDKKTLWQYLRRLVCRYHGHQWTTYTFSTGPSSYDIEQAGICDRCGFDTHASEKEYGVLRARYIAEAFIALSTPDTTQGISNLKLQKLLYYAHGFHLAIHRTPLFDEPVEAWVHGPVIRSVYDHYKGHGYEDICHEPGPSVVLSASEQELIQDVWQLFGTWSGKVLEDLATNERPYQEARSGLGEYDEATPEMDDAVIERYFKEEYMNTERRA